MGRLIDADKAIFELGVSDRDIYCKYHIEEQPTAYDVEAVVKQIEEFYLEAEEYELTGVITDIIEIVRNGGVK